MKTVTIFAAAALALAAAPAFAQTTAPTGAGPLGLNGSAYVTGGYTHDFADDVETGVLDGRLGWAFNPNVAVEAEGAVGVVKDEIAGVDVKTQAKLGGFLVGRAPVAPNVNLLGRVGYQHVWAEAEAAGVSVEADDGSFAFGVGGEFMLDDRNGIRADYTRRTEGDGVNSVGLSFVRKF